MPGYLIPCACSLRGKICHYYNCLKGYYYKVISKFNECIYLSSSFRPNEKIGKRIPENGGVIIIERLILLLIKNSIFKK